MMTFNASGVICQLGNSCFECMTLYTHFSVFSYLNMVIAVSGNGNDWTGMGTTTVIAAHL